MKEKRLGELSETQLENMMDSVLDETFDQMPADDEWADEPPQFFGTLKAMDDADTPERIVIKGHVENGEFVPHHADGASIEGKSIRVNRKAIIEIRIEAA